MNFLPDFGNLVLSTCLDNCCKKQEIHRDNQRHKTGQDALKTAFLANKKIPPRGVEHNSANNDSKTTYNSTPVKRWPESGTDSVKTPKISPDLQKIIDYWDSLPEHIKAAIKALIQSHIKETVE